MLIDNSCISAGECIGTAGLLTLIIIDDKTLKLAELAMAIYVSITKFFAFPFDPALRVDIQK